MMKTKKELKKDAGQWVMKEIKENGQLGKFDAKNKIEKKFHVRDFKRKVSDGIWTYYIEKEHLWNNETKDFDPYYVLVAKFPTRQTALIIMVLIVSTLSMIAHFC